jgi:hypothetical protein
MDEKQLQELVEKVGNAASARIAEKFAAYEAKAKEIAAEAVKNGGFITQKQYDDQKEASDTVITELKAIAKEQGDTLGGLMEKITSNPAKGKSVAQMLADHETKLKEVYNSRNGYMEFLLEQKASGEFAMRPFDSRNATKAAVTATIDGLGGGTASISQTLLASTLLRLGGNSAIESQYRNTPWIFDLVNVSTSEFVSGMPIVMYYEEIAKSGAATVVTEGATKPTVQYSYKLVSKTYKKVAQLISFTEEFSIDFRRLQDDILNKGRIDLLNVVNADVLANLIAAATLYNTSSSFTGGGTDMVEYVNDFDAIAAMAAQVDNATLGNLANAAIMSTFKKYRMGVTKDGTGAYVNRPEVLNGINFVGNPDMAANAVVVGDLKQYNVILRGGLIVRIGYNGTDFAENKFSVVMEQFYFDYISDVRKPAIVKGPDFATVRDAIGEDSTS